MKELRRFLSRQPEVALGLAAFAGLAIGAGWLPISLPSLGSIVPSSAKPATGTPTTASANTVQAAATAGPGADATSMWD